MASVCPGSPADPHATAQVQVRVRANCSTVRSEMLARVTSATWIDPHNNGTYAIENQSLWNRLDISRVSGAAAPGRYTDRIAFTFADEGAGAVSDPSTTAAGTNGVHEPRDRGFVVVINQMRRWRGRRLTR